MYSIDSFTAYNEAWEEGKIECPLVILIGGHMGTGKSTFAKKLEEKLQYVTTIPTGVVRAIQQANTSPAQSPYLFLHSYRLGTVNPDPTKSFEENTLVGFHKQAEVVQQAVSNMIEFSRTEGQQYIIEGNHVLPEFAAHHTRKRHIVALFFHVTDQEVYKQMISGATHRRMLTYGEQLATRYIHDYIANEAVKYHQQLFEFSEEDRATEFVAQRLAALSLGRDTQT